MAKPIGGIVTQVTGDIEAIRLLRVARRSAMKARTQAANQIPAVLDTSPDELRQRFTGTPTGQIVEQVARFHRRLPATPLEAARLTLRTLGRRWQHDDEIAMLDAHLDELTATAAPTLRAMNGVGDHDQDHDVSDVTTNVTRRGQVTELRLGQRRLVSFRTST